MSFLLILSEVRDLALETELPDLLPAESLSSLLLAGLRPEPGSAVMSAAQDLQRVSIALVENASTCDLETDLTSAHPRNPHTLQASKLSSPASVCVPRRSLPAAHSTMNRRRLFRLWNRLVNGFWLNFQQRDSVKPFWLQSATHTRTLAA